MWRHKVAVYRACRRLGVPGLGVLHDLSKLDPREWNPYVERFYGGHQPDTLPPAAREAYDRAWHLHQRRNKHHPTYWLLHVNAVGFALGKRDEPDFVAATFVALPMPERYVREMVADWEGARRAGAEGARGSTREWYEANGARLPLHPDTRRRVEQLLEELGG